MKNKKLIIILIISIIAVIAIVSFVIFNGNSKKNATINSDEILNIKNSKSDFNIKFESIEQKLIKGGFLTDDETYTIVKLKISNNTNSESTMYPFTNISLLNSKDEYITGTTIDLNRIVLNENIDVNTLLPDKLEANQTVEGDLYFATDSKDISKIQVSIPSGTQGEGDSIKIVYEQYFIKIK